MTTNHIDQLTEWWESAEVPTSATLPKDGDQIIIRYNSEWYEIATADGDADAHELSSYTRILARASKPKPAWHDAVAVIAHTARFSERRPFALTHTADVLDPYNTEWITRDDLIDPIPLIEAKVTDEMVLAALNAHMGLYLPSLPSFKRDEIEDMRYALTAALGLETK